jgi:hypothetical protein
MNIWLLDVWFNGYDYVIATNVRQARKIVADYNGFPEPLALPERIAVEGDGWKKLRYNKEFTVRIDHDVFDETPLFWITLWQEPCHLSAVRYF